MRSALLILGFTLLLLPAKGWAAWSGTFADQIISYDDDEYARAVQILRVPDAYLHAFWAEEAPSVREIHYGRSTDLGMTWSSMTADRVISFPDGNGVSPEECAVPKYLEWYDAPLIVVWSEDHEATREVHFGISTDHGITWSSETADAILSDPASAVDTGTPSVAQDWDGAFHVVWDQTTPNDGPAEVHYSGSLDGGLTWSGSAADRVISFPDGNPAIDPKIICDEDGFLYVVWREVGTGGDPAIHVGLSRDGGMTWSSETADREISPPASLIKSFAIAAEPCWDVGVHVVYAASHDLSSPYHYEIYSTSSWDHGVSWDGDDVLIPVSHNEDGLRSASNPDLFVGNMQGTFAVWDEEDETSGTKEQHISHLTDGWSGAEGDEIVSFPDGENGYLPSISGENCWITAGPEREVYYDTFVAWTEFAGDASDNYEVHLSAAMLIVSDADGEDPLLGLSLRAFPNPSEGAVRLAWASAADGLVTIGIFDASGRRVRSAESTDGAGSWTWDRRDDSGRSLAAGLYFARVRTAAATKTVGLVVY